VSIAKATTTAMSFIGLAYQGKDIVLRFIIEYNRFRILALSSRSLFVSGFLKDDILACVET
jgi:hypothetical protein